MPKHLSKEKILSSLLAHLCLRDEILFRIVRYMSYFLISLGCLTQVYIQTSDYLAKDVLFEITTRFPSVIHVPDITTCADINHFINYTRFKEKFADLDKEIRQFVNITGDQEFKTWTTVTNEGRDFVKSQLLKKLKVDQLLSVSYDENIFITTVQVTRNGSFKFFEDKGASEAVCDKVLFIKQFSICLSVKCSNRANYQLSKENILRTGGIMIRIYYRNEIAVNLNPIRLYLHSPNTYPRGEEIPYVTLQSHVNGRDYVISFLKYINNLQPPPYTTKCKNYRSIGFESQRHLIEHCQNSKSVVMSNSYFRGNIEYSNLTTMVSHSYFRDIFENETKQNIYENIVKSCKSYEAMPDCVREYYWPYILRNSIYRENSFRIQIILPKSPNLINISRPKFTFSQYILYIGSIFGTWFGFSFISLYNNLSTFFKKFHVKKNPKAALNGTIKANIMFKRRLKHRNQVHTPKQQKDLFLNNGYKKSHWAKVTPNYAAMLDNFYNNYQ